MEEGADQSGRHGHYGGTGCRRQGHFRWTEEEGSRKNDVLAKEQRVDQMGN